MSAKEGDWVILQLPDEYERLVQLKENEFGRFAANLLVGQKDGSYFRIESDGSLSCMLPEEIDNSIDTSKVTATNQTLQDTNTSQRLTASDIEALKAQVDMGSLDAKSMVEKLVQSSETFEKKNEFSQIKYVQRKQKKFLRWFVIRLPSARTICHHFMRRDPRKIMDLRLDILSQIVCLSNIQAENAKFLVWEETNGFLSGVLLSKMAPSSQIVNIHPDRQMQVPMIIHFNFAESYRLRLHSLSLNALDQRTEEEFREAPGTDAHRLALQRVRFENRKRQRELLNSWIEESLFDSLVVAVGQSDPLEIIHKLTPLLRPSSKIVIYSTWRELLLPSYIELRRSEEFVDVLLHESWSRPYQAAPGRIHPNMTCNGHAGTILSATKIVPAKP